MYLFYNMYFLQNAYYYINTDYYTIPGSMYQVRSIEPLLTFCYLIRTSTSGMCMVCIWYYVPYSTTGGRDGIGGGAGGCGRSHHSPGGELRRPEVAHVAHGRRPQCFLSAPQPAQVTPTTVTYGTSHSMPMAALGI